MNIGTCAKFLCAVALASVGLVGCTGDNSQTEGVFSRDAPHGAQRDPSEKSSADRQDQTIDGLMACLDSLGAEYEVVEADGGQALTPAKEADAASRARFSDALTECHGEEATPSAQDLKMADLYLNALIKCLQDRGYEAVAKDTGKGSWELLTPGVDQSTGAYQAASSACSDKAARVEADRRSGG